jgi:uncharacterized membrane protein
MTLQEQPHPSNSTDGRLHLANRRWPLLALVAGAGLMILFYSATEGAYVDHDPLLTGGDWAGYALCHRISARSFTIDGRQFPLCARCTGMYLGAAFTFLALFLAGRTRRVLLPRRGIFLGLISLIALMGIDGINSYSHFFPDAPHLYEPRNWLRLATGMGAGLTLGIITFAALAQALWRQAIYRPLLENWRELAALVALGVVGILLTLSNQPALLYVLALASAAGLILVVTGLNTAVLLLFLRSDGQNRTWLDATGPLLTGLALTVLELSALGAVRWTMTGTLTGFPGL